MGDHSLRPRLPKVVSVGRPAPSPWCVPSSRRASRLRHLLRSVASIRVRWRQWWCQRCASLNGHRAVRCSRCRFPACQNDRRLFARRHGFAAVSSSFWVQVPLPAVQRSPSSDESYMFFGSIRLPWPGPACPGTRGPPFSVQVPQIYSPGDPPRQCSSGVELPPSQLPPLLPSPRVPASPQRRSLACSLSRSPEVPCLPFPFPALQAGASCMSASGCPDSLMFADQSGLGDVRSSAPSLSAARSSVGGRPHEVAVVARSFSTAACVVLASGVSTPPVSISPSVACTLFFSLVTGPPMPPLTTRTSSFASLLWVSSVSFDSSFSSYLPSLHILLPRLSRGTPLNPTCLSLPPVSPALPHIPCVGSFSFTLRSEFASTSAPPSPTVQLPGPTTRPVVCDSLSDRLPPVAPLLDVELGISLPDALDALKVSLPPEQLELLRSSFVAAVAPVSRSNLTKLRRELRRIGASAASILPPGAARVARRASPHVVSP